MWLCVGVKPSGLLLKAWPEHHDLSEGYGLRRCHLGQKRPYSLTWNSRPICGSENFMWIISGISIAWNDRSLSSNVNSAWTVEIYPQSSLLSLLLQFVAAAVVAVAIVVVVIFFIFLRSWFVFPRIESAGFVKYKTWVQVHSKHPCEMGLDTTLSSLPNRSLRSVPGFVCIPPHHEVEKNVQFSWLNSPKIHWAVGGYNNQRCW